jgi:hypothetical protein
MNVSATALPERGSGNRCLTSPKAAPPPSCSRRRTGCQLTAEPRSQATKGQMHSERRRVIDLIASLALLTGGLLGGCGGGGSAGSSGAATAAQGVLPSSASSGGLFADTSNLPLAKPGVSTAMLTAPGAIPSVSTDPFGDGAFRLLCNWSKISYDDPMVYPGQPGAAHLHTFFGNTAIDAFTTPDNIRSKGNASCRGGTVNLSGYWVPAMINVATSQPVLPGGLIVYYKTGFWTWMGNMLSSPIQPIPKGLRMIVGDASRITANPDGWFACLGSNGLARDGTGGTSIPSCVAGETLRVHIDFPQCWDGVNLDSPDHKSHMSRPVAWWDDPATKGQPSPDAQRPFKCPADHPVVLPLITFNTDYPVTVGDDTSKWRLASDTYDSKLPGGYSVHADWMNGWDPVISDIWGMKCMRDRRDCGSYNLGDGRGAIEFQGN